MVKHPEHMVDFNPVHVSKVSSRVTALEIR
jgi:hypothetical protein